MWGNRRKKDILFAFDEAYAADPYRVHSIVAGAVPQIGGQFRAIQVFCQGGYRGPSFRGSETRVIVARPPRRWQAWLAGVTSRLALTEPRSRWVSNITAPLEPLLRCFARYRDYGSVVTFSADLPFAITVFRLAHIFAHDKTPHLLGVIPATTPPRDLIQEAAWLGATLLCDGALAAATAGSPAVASARWPVLARTGTPWRDEAAIPFAAKTPLRFTHAETYPATTLETSPAVRWNDHVQAGDTGRPPARDVVLFVRPDWEYCGSATTFQNLARYFHDRGALMIDIAIWPYAGAPAGRDQAARIAEEQKTMGAALYFSVQRSAAVPHLLAQAARMVLRLPPTNIVRQKLLQYALAARPPLLRMAMQRVRISHVYLNHFFTHQYARRFIGRRPFFLDTHDIQSVNWVQGGAVNFITGKGDHFHTLLRDELRILSKAHRLCFVNADELALAQRTIPGEKLDVIVALPEITPCARKTLGAPSRLLIVASRNQPNRRSLEWFLRSVWPLVLAAYRHAGLAGGAPRLDICGTIAEDFAGVQIEACHFHGQVEDLYAFYAAADVVLLPVVIGSGVAIKTIEAILHGRPVVATRHALRGLPEAIVRCIGSANEPQDFAAAVVRLVSAQAELDSAVADVVRAAGLIREQGYYGRLDAAMNAVRAPTILRGADFATARDDPALGDSLLDQVTRALERYFRAGERAAALIADPAKLVFDSDPSWLPSIFARRVVHDDDYRIFGYFRDQDSLVLDIGANYGYSVASMFAAGCQSCVLSFDPIAPLAACLAEVVRLNPGRCDYRMAALGAGEGIQRFVMPVINNRGITALTTADTQPHLESLAESLCLYKTRHMAGEPFSSLTFHTFAAPVQTLDAALRSGGPFEVPTNSIVAAKIDTEGTEAAVLAGARDTLTAHRPLILIEGANRQPSVRAILQGAGYEFADRGDDRLSLSADISMRPNGFFVHRSRLDEYRACGLLCA